MRRLSISLLAMLLVLFQPVYSQSKVYYVAEEQLLELEAESKKQEELVKNLQALQKESEAYCKELESKNVKTAIKSGVISFTVGFIVGGAVMFIANGVNK